jgi:hypothetical protein
MAVQSAYHYCRPLTALDDAIDRLFDAYDVEAIGIGQLVDRRVQTVRLFKGSRLVARAYVNLDTAEYVVRIIRRE